MGNKRTWGGSRDFLDYRRLFEAVHPILLAQDREIEELETRIRRMSAVIETAQNEIACLKIDLERAQVRA